jgi:Mg2+ and Co2+ transporter CorA
MKLLSDNFINEWKHIINKVDKTDIPPELIESVVIKLTNDTTHEIDVKILKKRGIHPEDIEDILNETLHELRNDIETVDFFLDIEAVANTVQPETDKLLYNIQ